MIMEKAWAKLHGSYDATEAGNTADTLNYLCGGMVNSIDFGGEDRTLAFEALRSQLMDGQASRQFVLEGNEHLKRTRAAAFFSCSPYANSRSQLAQLRSVGLVYEHAYAVLDAVVLPNGVKLLQLRNPLGNKDFKGDWGDNDPRWTDELRAATRRPGGGKQDDGTFVMTLEDFARYFDSVGVCDPSPLLKEDTTGDGMGDRAHLTSVRLASGYSSWSGGQVATCTVPSSDKPQEIFVTVFQRDKRGTENEYNEVMVGLQGVDGHRGWHYPSKLSSKIEFERPDITYYTNRRCRSATVTLQPGQTQFQLCTRALRMTAQYVGDRNQAVKQNVWVSLATPGACEVTVREEEGGSMLPYVSGGAVCVCCALGLAAAGK